MSDSFIPRVLGITGSLFLSGFAFSASYYTLPATALAPSPLRLKQWLVVYDLGKLISPPLSVISATCWFYSAWVSHSTHAIQLHSAAGALTLGTTIWTVLAMMPTNKALMTKVKAVDEAKGEEIGSSEWKREAEKELASWSWMNYVRAVIPLAGGWVGMSAALK
ncbi:hypothetical protein ONS95_013185 [Cadophora gregata]|uniref:uncharacterized protein n=1 Tax=Cadophora gregata TaxID=51156 RepID=UPI0026DDA9B8|nr:uncharacterized protein ONS95_013185 [Cadophora gregata]KAK0099997.1 hypothetical protein ONS96_007940 [Cadophora gregata f. sp. sojae]KAK0116155.1 hypothetical protein ONS95_013185 [Cadophora gregata]